MLVYYEQWANRMEDYLNGIDEDRMRSIRRGPFSQDMLVAVGMSATFESFYGYSLANL